MNDINMVTIIGRLTRDGEMKYTNSGTPVCKFAVAVNSSKKNGDQWVEEAHFFDVVLWGKSGEAVAKYLLEGKQVGVMGELRQNRWEQDGQPRSKVEIHAIHVQLLGEKKHAQGDEQGNAPNSFVDDPIPF